MNNVLDLRLRRFVPVGLIALAAAVLLAPAPAGATPYVVKLVQQGSNVVATGSGEFDLSGLTFVAPGGAPPSGMISIAGYLAFNSAMMPGDVYTGYSGPANFGSGAGASPTSVAGDTIALDTPDQFFYVPTGYVSGTALSDSATYPDSFAILGLSPGTYVWSWGSAADQSFTLIIGGGMPTVPEPAALGMFGFGALLISAFVGLRRRVA